jgi:hypothetical protein
VNLRIVVAGLGLAVLAVGCGSSSSGGNASVQPSISTTPSTSVTPTGSGPASTPPTSPVTTPPQSSSSSPAPTVTDTTTNLTSCQSANLKLSLGPSDGAAGTTYQEVVFTNTGTSSCTLHGFPGVSYVDAGGTIIGKPTTEDPGARITVVLAVKGKAHSLLRQPDAGNFPAARCHLTTTDRLQVYPPGETHQLFVTDRTQVCATGLGRGGIGPVRAGVGSP